LVLGVVTDWTFCFFSTYEPPPSRCRSVGGQQYPETVAQRHLSCSETSYTPQQSMNPFSFIFESNHCLVRCRVICKQECLRWRTCSYIRNPEMNSIQRIVLWLNKQTQRQEGRNDSLFSFGIWTRLTCATINPHYRHLVLELCRELCALIFRESANVRFFTPTMILTKQKAPDIYGWGSRYVRSPFQLLESRKGDRMFVSLSFCSGSHT
jgi:hypothetical protein